MPEPPARPGALPDFSAADIPAAGATPRPDPTTPAGAMRDHAFGLVRVLGEDNAAHGPWTPAATPEMLRRMLRSMALTRAFDDRMFRAQRQGKTSFYMKCR